MGEEGRVVPIGNDQGSTEMGFKKRAKDDPHDDRGCGKVGMLHEIADDSKDQGDIDFGHAVVGGISTSNGDDQDERKEDGERDL